MLWFLKVMQTVDLGVFISLGHLYHTLWSSSSLCVCAINKRKSSSTSFVVERCTSQILGDYYLCCMMFVRFFDRTRCRRRAAGATAMGVAKVVCVRGDRTCTNCSPSRNGKCENVGAIPSRATTVNLRQELVAVAEEPATGEDIMAEARECEACESD